MARASALALLVLATITGVPIAPLGLDSGTLRKGLARVTPAQARRAGERLFTSDRAAAVVVPRRTGGSP
jgi:hypothetical protein